jgi:hypothetical protein
MQGRTVRATRADGPRQTKGDFGSPIRSKHVIAKLEQDIHESETKFLQLVHYDTHNKFHQTIWWKIYPRIDQRLIYENPKMCNIWINCMENFNIERKTSLLITTKTLGQSALKIETAAIAENGFQRVESVCERVRQWRKKCCWRPRLT